MSPARSPAELDELMPDYSIRSDGPELMDDLSIGGDELRQTLDQIATINGWLGGYRPSIAGVRKLLPRDATGFSLLDVGCGKGDTCQQIARWARRHKLDATLRGIDLHEDTINHARACLANAPGAAITPITPITPITFDVQDLFEMPDEPVADIVHAAMVLHHFPGDTAKRALEKMSRLARIGVVVNDIHRHWFAYRSINLLTGLLSRNRLVRNDAGVSVLRAFVRKEWRDLCDVPGYDPPDVRWRWAFRWQVTMPRSR